MRLYATLWMMGLQEALQYRVEAMIWFLFDVVPPIMMAFLWLAAYQDQTTIAGYDLAAMLTYTMGVMVLRTVLTTHVEWGIDFDIRNGWLSTRLTQPFPLWTFWFLTEMAWKVIRSLLVTPVVLLCLLWLGPSMGGNVLSLASVPLLVLSLVFGYLVSFFLKLCLGLLSFWLNDITGLSTLYEVIAVVFGGVLLPIALLPGPLQTVALALPIGATYHIPLSILLGQTVGLDAWWAIGQQVLWLGLLALLGQALWRRGLRRYESVGG
ncbi:MAG: ABC-2 family transporter protein [Chloroflexi bacterium]|nr:ABC-2 family transporter protein [Chloroflexota bacterium]